MILVSQEKIDDYTAKGWWSHTTLGDLFIHNARRQPEALAVLDPPNRMAITGEAPLRWRWCDLLAQVGRTPTCSREWRRSGHWETDYQGARWPSRPLWLPLRCGMTNAC